MSRIKVADGSTPAIDMLFVDEELAVQLREHIADNVSHITQAERLKWNNKITCEDQVDDHTLILTRN